MARPLTERKNIDLDTEIEPDLPVLLQDQAKVQQILNNLLSNAIKFTPEGGRIVVSAERDDADDLLLKVADTGIGIADEDQVAIFEKFRQGKSVLTGGDAMTREYSGTGLGLSIVKELCKLLGGEVSLGKRAGQGQHVHRALAAGRAPISPRIDSALPSPVDDLANSRRGDLPRALRRRPAARRRKPLRHRSPHACGDVAALLRLSDTTWPRMSRHAARTHSLPEVQLFTDGALQRQSGPRRLGVHPAPSGLGQGTGSAPAASRRPPTTAWS